MQTLHSRTLLVELCSDMSLLPMGKVRLAHKPLTKSAKVFPNPARRETERRGSRQAHPAAEPSLPPLLLAAHLLLPSSLLIPSQ